MTISPIQRAGFSLWVAENAYIDLIFRQDAARCYLLRLSASGQMPSGFVKRTGDACLRFVPLEHPCIEPKKWHRIEFEMQADRFLASVDGKGWGTFEDGSFPDGFVGFSSGFPSVKIDHLEVAGTELVPGEERREFRLVRGNPYRRIGRILLIVCSCGLYFLLEKILLVLAGLSGSAAFRKLDRDLVVPLLLVSPAFFVSLFPKVLLLVLSGFLVLFSRVRFLFLRLGNVWGRVSRRVRRLCVSMICLAFLVALALGLTKEKEIRLDGSKGTTGTVEDAGVRAVELNFPFSPESDDFQNFLWDFEASLGEGSVAEIVFRKRDDREPVVAPEKGEGQNWYAFILSTEPLLPPGFAKIEEIDRYQKKVPEESHGALPAGIWFPVRLKVDGNTFSCRAGENNLSDGLVDDDFVSGRCRVTLLKGALQIRHSKITPLAPLERYPSAWEAKVFPDIDPPQKPLRSPGSVDGLNWYLKTSYRFENSLLSNQTFRDRRFRREKPADTLRIVCMGGSSTYGILLPEGSEADYPHELERQLVQAFPSRLVEVINAAVVGTYSLRSVEYLDAVLLPFRPDVVLVNLAWNDNIIPAAIERGYPLFREHLNGWRRNPLLAPFLYAKEWVDFVCRSERLVGRMKNGQEGAWVINPENLPVYESNLEKLVDIAESHGAKIAFILEPSTDLLVVQEGKEALSDFYEIERRVASRRKIPVIDPRAILRENRYDDLFCDVMHLTPVGHRRMAQVIRERMTEAWPELFAGETVGIR